MATDLRFIVPRAQAAGTPVGDDIYASRTSGTAPLVVHFSMFETDATNAEYFDTSYEWDFGDTGAGTWQDELSKNVDIGPMAAHVFETEGSYTVTLTKRNATGIIGTETIPITVADPDVTYAADNTVCISTDSDFTGAPSGCTTRPNITGNALVTQIESDIGNGKRVLLKRGDSWTVTSTIDISGVTGATVGAFGTGTSPDDRGIFSNAPEITVSSGSNLFSFAECSDVRVEHITGDGVSNAGIAFNFPNQTATTNKDHILIHKCKASNFSQGSMTYTNDGVSLNVWALVACHFDSCNGNTIMGSALRFVFLGNSISGDSLSSYHRWRLNTAWKMVMAHNFTSTSQADDGGHGLKFHSLWPRNPNMLISQYTAMTSNVWGGGGYIRVEIGPQTAGIPPSWDERVSFVLIERNRWISDYDNVTHGGNQLSIHAVDVVVRNNIFNPASTTVRSIDVGQKSIEPAPNNIEIYNNTIYRSDSSTGSKYGISADATCSNVAIKNNYIYLTTSGTKNYIVDNSVGGDVSNNLEGPTPFLTDPDNVTPLDRVYTLTASQTDAIDAGATVPVYGDFNTNGVRPNPGTYDIGADEY